MQPVRDRLQGVVATHLVEYPPRIRHHERLSAGRLLRPFSPNLKRLLRISLPPRPCATGTSKPSAWRRRHPTWLNSGVHQSGADRRSPTFGCQTSLRTVRVAIHRRWGGHARGSARMIGPVPRQRPHDLLAPSRAAICFSRRRCTEEGMRSASRYLATVRRAMSMPSCLSCSTILSSDSTAAGRLGVDQLADAMAHRFGGVRLLAVGRGDGGGEEVLELEHAARRRHVLVGGDAAHRRFVHRDGIRHRLQVERLQVLRCRGSGSRPAGARSPRPRAGWCAPADRGS